MKELIPLSEPYLTEAAIAEVTACLKSGWVSSAGHTIAEFENLLKKQLNVEHVVCVTSGTAALHLALLALGVDGSQEVIVPTMTFAASLNPVIYCGALPILIDVKPDTYSIDLDLLETFLINDCELKAGKTFNKKTARLISAIIPVQLYGNVCDMQRLSKLASDYGLLIVEDAAESLGSTYTNKAAGTFGKLGILSFNGNKIITTGQGGAVVTNDAELARHVRHLSTQAKSDALRYIHDEVGYNYRMASLNAALGISQLNQLAQIIKLKKSHFDFYQQALKNLPLRFQSPTTQATHSRWINTIVFDDGAVNSWEDLKQHLDDHKIQFRPLWYPLHLLKPYKDLEVLGGDTAATLYKYGLCLPSSAGLNTDQLDRVCSAIRSFFA